MEKTDFRLTKTQALRFLFAKQGLLGKKRFFGKDGIMEYIRQAGCIQFDPVDACGKNADLTLQSRIDRYDPRWLYDLLYEERKLIDSFDKNLSILPIEDWSLVGDAYDWFVENPRSQEAVEAVRETIKTLIREKGPLCSRDVDMAEKTDWYWSASPLGRVALESMFYAGDLIVHHKERTIKYYALTEDFVPESFRIGTSPLSPAQRKESRVLRRIGAVGLMWNRHSDAFLSIGDLKTPERNDVFAHLQTDGKIFPVFVEGLKETFFARMEDRELLENTLAEPLVSPRVEFLAPLDPMMWDRKLILALSGFEYTWEIYTEESKRKYGYYVLPMIFQDRFVGRIEFLRDTKAKRLQWKNIWLENGWKPTKAFEKALDEAVTRFAKFNGCDAITDLRPQNKGE